MEISALTRTVVKPNHAVISTDGYVNSNVPGWTDCAVNVIINEQMGARLCQTLVTMNEKGQLIGVTDVSQIFFYVLKGQCQVMANNEEKKLTAGQFACVPVKTPYKFSSPEKGTQLLTFHKVYEKLEGH